MECTDAHIGAKNDFFALFYEDLGGGDHLSRIYQITNPQQASSTLVVEVRAWIVSIWAGLDGQLFGVSWDGHLYRFGERADIIASVGLLGVIKLKGYGTSPKFIVGEEGNIFESSGISWEHLPNDSEADVYDVALKDDNQYVFAASDGVLISVSDGNLFAEQLPTNVDLHSIAFRSPEHGIAVGAEGAMFQFDNGGWEDITQDDATRHGVHYFKGRYFISVEEQAIVEISDDNEFIPSYDQTGYYFSSNDKYCLTFNDDAAHLFDGFHWISIPFPGLITT